MGEGGGEVTHTMTEEEYAKYCEDLEELKRFKRIEANFE
jgi:hypothetical protein